MVATLACGSEDGGDDLPPGAFTSGPNESGNIDVSTGSSSGGGASQTSQSTEPPTTTDPTAGSETPVELSHDEHILPIWLASCLGSSCHDTSSTVSMLDLQADGQYDAVCGGAHGQSGMPYIDCTGFDPQNSYIFRKLEGSHGDVSGGMGGIMPPTGMLDDATLSTIENWIAGGALP